MKRPPSRSPCVLRALLLGALASMTAAQSLPGSVLDQQKISASEGGFTGVLDPSDRFGTSVVAVGDVNGDMLTDLAVGAVFDDDGLPEPNPNGGIGAVWILFMTEDGTVGSHAKISATQGGFPPGLDFDDRLGSSIAPLGDLDDDGVPDLAVGLPNDNPSPGTASGSVYLLFLDAAGTVKTSTFFGGGVGGFVGPLGSNVGFGESVALLEADDENDVVKLAVGANRADGHRGEVWIVWVNGDGVVFDEQRIASGVGGFDGQLDPFDLFGSAVAGLGDLDGDGVADLAVGAERDDDGGSSDRGAVWILFLTAEGLVKDSQKISSTTGGFVGELKPPAFFGSGLACLGDVDQDGVNDLAVGAAKDDDSRGALWILMLRPDGTLKSHQKVFNEWASPSITEFFGEGVGALGGTSGDAIPDVVVGVPLDDDGANNAGAIRLLTLSGPPGPGWVELPGALGGSLGLPSLTGAGPLLADQLYELLLTSALPDSTAWLVAGGVVYNLPFRGGTLVPVPVFTVPLPTDAAGELAIAERWPAGIPSGFTTYYQCWIQDPGAPAGLAASNALAATTP